MKYSKTVITFITTLIIIGSSIITTKAADIEVESIVANTSIGDGFREVQSFEILVNDGQLIADLSSGDFDIKNNVPTIPIDPVTNVLYEEYADDGIEVIIEDNKITLIVKPFSYLGKYILDETGNSAGISPWSVECSKYPELSFTEQDVDNIVTRTLDDTIYGSYTYAGITREYALYLPKNADGSTKTNVPLVVWNHGGGSYQVNIQDVVTYDRGLTAWPEAGYETAVLEIAVSNENYMYHYMWGDDGENRKSLIDQNNALQAAIIRDLISDGTVDDKRVYVAGASSGGGATMRFIMQYPEIFAGAIAVCSMDPIVPVHFNTEDSYEQIVSNFEDAFQGEVYTWDESINMMVSKSINTEALLNLPIYYTHAENDDVCSSTSSYAMYDAMRNLGDINNMIKVYNNEEMLEVGLGSTLLHWSWVNVLNSNEEGTPMNWLFKQVRSAENLIPDENNEDEGNEQEQTEDNNDKQKDTSNAKVVKTGDSISIGVFGLIAIGSIGLISLLRKKVNE